jgi:hypothetical protein
MVAHSTPKAGVEWGTQSLGCRCREDGSFLSRLASTSGLLMNKGLWGKVAHSTPKAGVEWGTQSLGCRCREDGSFLSRLASTSGLLMNKGLWGNMVAHSTPKSGRRMGYPEPWLC